MALSQRKKIIIGASALVVLIAIILISVFASRKDTPEVVTVKIEKRHELRSTVTASGEVRPIQFMNLTSEVQGRIEEIYVKEGDQVKKGQPLVRLDPTALQSNTDAQLAALQASQNDVQVSRSQILAAQNQLSQAQQTLTANQAAVDTASVEVSSARQQVVAAQTDVDKAQVEVNAANRELKRSENLLESGVVSRLEVDNAKDRVANAQVSLQNAKARLQSQQIAVKESQSRVNEAKARVNQQAVAIKDAQRGVDTANLSANSSESRANQQAALLRGQQNQRNKTLQVAPINGVIAEIPSKVGTFAVAGLSTTALMTIADMSTVNVEVKVDETEIDKVEVGQLAKIKVDAFGDKEIVGEVTQKTPLALGKSQTTGGLSTNINTQEAKEFRVVIQLKDLSDDVHDSLRPGMSATAVITTKTVQDVIAVPLQAIVEKQPDASPTIQTSVPAPADKPKPIKGVYVLNGNKVKFVEVTTGISGESDIQITSGVNEGDEVITGPSRVLKTLKEGDVVKRQTAQSAAAANANKS
ncbi:MAG: HlyD family secretion protein [Pyrinomonadaceae bacterium]